MFNRRVIARLRTSCSAVALLAALSLGRPALAETAAPPELADFRPVTTIALEGAFLFNRSERNYNLDDLDKLGAPPMRPGGDAWAGRLEVGHQPDPDWDFKVGAGMIRFEEEEVRTDGFAQQDLRMVVADLEAGYRVDTGGDLDLRLLGGVRAVYASGRSTWEDSDKFGDYAGSFKDDTWAVGPRVGAELALPVLPEYGVAVLGSLSGAALFGERRGRYFEEAIGFWQIRERWTSSVTVLNADAQAGLRAPLGPTELTLGYRATYWDGLAAERSASGPVRGSSDVLAHGPFIRIAVPFR